jgi:hypothetical protein
VSADQADLDQAAFEGFSLALRVMIQAFEIDAPGTQFERPWAMLRDIAEGRSTITSPAELAARFPHLSEFLFDRINLVIESDRETARRVLRGLSTAF